MFSEISATKNFTYFIERVENESNNFDISIGIFYNLAYNLM